MKLMLIDDQIGVLQSLKEAIEPKGHECITYNNPLDAVATFKKETFDAVITDMKMPKMDGIGVIHAIHKVKPDTPVIILTGYANTRNAIDAVNSGAYGYYEKPLNLKKFFDMLSKLEEELDAQGTAGTNGLASFENKDIILKEMHHRIKNDLQFISSMINIQCRNISNPDVVDVLTNTKNRINAIANSHDQLLPCNSINLIDLKLYFRSLIHDLDLKFGIREKKIEVDLEINEFAIQKNVVSYMGILVNEIVTNSIKHAFPDSLDRKPVIRIDLSKEKNSGILLTISDNGIGLPKGFNLNQSNSLGLYLIRTIAEELLGGTIQIKHQNGTKFIFRLHAKS